MVWDVRTFFFSKERGREANRLYEPNHTSRNCIIRESQLPRPKNLIKQNRFPDFDSVFAIKTPTSLPKRLQACLQTL